MNRRTLLTNDTARISFAIIGIFLILGSSATSVYIQLNIQEREDDVTWNADQDQIESLLSMARIDLTQIVNQAGTNALQYIGNHPVIIAENTFSSAQLCNEHRLKNEISTVLSNYLLCNYVDSSICSLGNLKLTIDPSIFPNQRIAQDAINLSSFSMQLDRPLSVLLFGPEQQQNIPVYYHVSIDVPIIISSANEQKEPISMTLSLSTILTTRYLALQELISSFNESLNGFGPFWRTFTLLTNIYSMARGYRHYQTSLPQNIVDNHHLELLTNIVLLFEETLTFGGIDPQLLFETISHSKNIFSNQEVTNITTTNSLSSNWIIPFSDLQQPFAEESSDSEQSSEIQIVNISDIASAILWNKKSIDLYFLDNSQNDHHVIYEYTSSKTLNETIQEYLDLGWTLKDSSMELFVQNQTTLQTMQTICEHVYSAEFYTSVHRNGPTSIMIGNHQGYPIDNGSSNWIITQTLRQSQLQKPDIGEISIGSTVFQEVYTIIWQRNHQWSNKTTQTINNESVTTWESATTFDTKYEYNVTFSIIVDDYSQTNQYPGLIKDVFYESQSFSDTNLETTIPTYISEIYTPHKTDLFNLANGMYFRSMISESIPSWLLNDAISTLEEVYHLVTQITIDKEINPITYPNPKDLITQACSDLVTKFENNITFFEQKNLYCTNGEFNSTGLKSLYEIRKWYIDCIHQEINTLAQELNEDVSNAITDALGKAGFNDDSLFDESMDDSLVSSLHRQIAIPFSIPLELTKTGKSQQKTWNETLLFSIDHKPSYFSCFSEETYDGKTEYFLGIRNTCLLGPSGLPLLPLTPTTPWIVTLNTWLIQVRGSIAEFSLCDTGDESVFHPLFGHEPQEFVRKHEIIRANDGSLLGWNTRISFSADTVSCSLVPSWGCMVGDTNGVLSEHNGREI